MRVLVVEDDASVADGILDGLAQANVDALHVSTGQGGLDALSSYQPDLVLLDLGLPDMDGTEVCRRIRAVSQTPIIVVSARDDEIDRVVALEMGADDYVVKPFGMRELVARIRAVARRTGPTVAEPAAARTGGRDGGNRGGSRGGQQRSSDRPAQTAASEQGTEASRPPRTRQRNRTRRPGTPPAA